MKTKRTLDKVVVLLITLLLVFPFGMAPYEMKKVRVSSVSTGGGRQSEVIEERDETESVVRQIVYAHGRPMWQILPDGSSQYLHEDPRGNTIALTEGTGLPTDNPGDVLERVTCDAYGKPVFEDANNQPLTDAAGDFLAESQYGNTQLCSGLWYDPETANRTNSPTSDYGGFYLMDSGFYNPDEGRFTTRKCASRLCLPHFNPRQHENGSILESRQPTGFPVMYALATDAPVTPSDIGIFDIPTGGGFPGNGPGDGFPIGEGCMVQAEILDLDPNQVCYYGPPGENGCGPGGCGGGGTGPGDDSHHGDLDCTLCTLSYAACFIGCAVEGGGIFVAGACFFGCTKAYIKCANEFCDD